MTVMWKIIKIEKTALKICERKVSTTYIWGKKIGEQHIRRTNEELMWLYDQTIIIQVAKGEFYV